jgi:hypothetical protein
LSSLKAESVGQNLKLWLRETLSIGCWAGYLGTLLNRMAILKNGIKAFWRVMMRTTSKSWMPQEAGSPWAKEIRLGRFPMSFIVSILLLGVWLAWVNYVRFSWLLEPGSTTLPWWH